MSLKTRVKRALHSCGIASTLACRDGASFILAAHIVQEEEAELLADIIRLVQRSFSLVSLDEMLDALRAGRFRRDDGAARRRARIRSAPPAACLYPVRRARASVDPREDRP